MPEAQPLYLDFLSTTPLDERVFAEMRPYFIERFGNPSSAHQPGLLAANAVQKARERVAALAGVMPGNIVFTASASEANNLAIKGLLEASAPKAHIITCAVEHNSVLGPCRKAERRGAALTILPVDGKGRVDPGDVLRAIRPETVLVSVQHANNEIGTVQDVASIAAVCRERGVLFHMDAAQSAAKIAIDVTAIGADMASFSAHKMYGPKGAAALYVRGGLPRVRLEPLIDGGGQERGLRAGTLNVPAIVGFGSASAIAMQELPREGPRLAGMRDAFEDGIISGYPTAVVNGDLHSRLPGASSITFPGLNAVSLVRRLRSLALSTGSACASDGGGPSHVLRAIGLHDAFAAGTLRVCFGRPSSDDDVRFAVGEMLGALLQSDAPAA